MMKQTIEGPSCSGRSCSACWPILLIALIAGIGFLAWGAQDASEHADEPSVAVSIESSDAPSAPSQAVPQGIVWHHSLDESPRNGKLRFVLFTADWCRPCHVLKKNVLADAEVESILSREFECVKIDLTSRNAQAMSAQRIYRVNGIPAIRVIDSDGGVVAGWNGIVQKSVLLPQLEQMIPTRSARAG